VLNAPKSAEADKEVERQPTLPPTPQLPLPVSKCHHAGSEPEADDWKSIRASNAETCPAGWPGMIETTSCSLPEFVSQLKARFEPVAAAAHSFQPRLTCPAVMTADAPPPPPHSGSETVPRPEL
jgi:hypothetical protein